MSEMTHFRFALPTRDDDLSQFEKVWSGDMWRASHVEPEQISTNASSRHEAKLAIVQELAGMYYLTASEVAERIGAEFDVSSLLSRLYRQGILERVEVGGRSYAYRVSARKERAA